MYFNEENEKILNDNNINNNSKNLGNLIIKLINDNILYFFIEY